MFTLLMEKEKNEKQIKGHVKEDFYDYFTQNENVYKQNQGTPMGSLMSVVLA